MRWCFDSVGLYAKLCTQPESSCTLTADLNTNPRPPVSKRGLFKTEEYLEAMIEKRKFLPIAAIAAVALTVSACGGGGDSMSMMDGDGMDPTMTEPAGPSVADLFAAAHNARGDADAAAEAAAQAVKDAVMYSTMYTAAAVHGDSMTAAENAQKVLDAKAAADTAVTDAMAAKMAAGDRQDRCGEHSRGRSEQGRCDGGDRYGDRGSR